MAGYVISIGNKNEEELFEMISTGVYGTILNIKKTWSQQNEGTLADYLSMKSGDHVYFFRDRKIYGVGELIGVGDHDCKLLNYKGSDVPNTYPITQKEMVINNPSVRFICTFKPKPAYFKKGLDMDYVLQSNPEAFRMLRVFWKLSFIKIDDKEDKALFDIVLRENEIYLSAENYQIQPNYSLHDKLMDKSSKELNLSLGKIIQESRVTNKFKREMSLEAAVIERLSNSNVFGNWDYVSHQVVASPFKPVDYMDKMDIFGYKFITGFDTISKYLVMELKKDRIGNEVVNQTMKYVDWINQEYSNGDFDMIEAFIIANEFDEGVIEHCENFAIRKFTKNKPAINKVWNNLKLIKYEVDEENQVTFNRIY